uniref:Uncharacterized protein n=1 Tax=Anguilla anguilla TaxID=7936 RepID=A0A0E9Q678_ANGAN
MKCGVGSKGLFLKCKVNLFQR